jgi:hypothetical protein
MAQRADRLKKLLADSVKTADQTQRAFLKAEASLTELEAREHRQSAREPGQSDDLVRRMPELGRRS